MTFVFVPIPTTETALGKTAPLWMPFIEKISRRKGSEPLASLVSQVANFEVHIGMVWDETRAHGLIAWQLRRIGEDLVADLVWMVGRDAKNWRHLISDLERYLKEHLGCVMVRPKCRPGWAPFLKERGYKVTHYVMEKPL